MNKPPENTKAHAKPDKAEAEQTLKEAADIDAALDEALEGTFPASDPIASFVKPRPRSTAN
jgi:hypothetical protein